MYSNPQDLVQNPLLCYYTPWIKYAKTILL